MLTHAHFSNLNCCPFWQRLPYNPKLPPVLLVASDILKFLQNAPGPTTPWNKHFLPYQTGCKEKTIHFHWGWYLRKQLSVCQGILILPGYPKLLSVSQEFSTEILINNIQMPSAPCREYLPTFPTGHFWPNVAKIPYMEHLGHYHLYYP